MRAEVILHDVGWRLRLLASLPVSDVVWGAGFSIGALGNDLILILGALAAEDVLVRISPWVGEKPGHELSPSVRLGFARGLGHQCLQSLLCAGTEAVHHIIHQQLRFEIQDVGLRTADFYPLKLRFLRGLSVEERRGGGTNEKKSAAGTKKSEEFHSPFWMIFRQRTMLQSRDG